MISNYPKEHRKQEVLLKNVKFVVISLVFIQGDVVRKQQQQKKQKEQHLNVYATCLL